MKANHNMTSIFKFKHSKSTILILLMMVMMYSCDDIYDNVKEYAKGETIYAPTFDTCYATLGYERAEIDLRKDGRIPSGKFDKGSAIKTVVVYDENTPSEKVIIIDSLCSYVNITELTEPRIYRFKIYTEDKFGNRSIPQEIALVPYTSADVKVLKEGILDPVTSVAPNALVMEWPTSLHTLLMEYHGLTYEFENQEGDTITGSCGKNPRIYSGNLPAGEEVVFNMKYRLLPLLDDGRKLLDTIEVEKPFLVKMPTKDQPFIPQELKILRANGVTEFTTENVENVTSITYPMNMTTFADLFYFPNITSLDLTGRGLEGILETLTYAKNDMRSIVGGGKWQEFMMPVDKPALIKTPESLQTLKDLLDAGQIKHIKYIPKSLGLEFDKFLAPYIESGIVELLDYDRPHSFFPDRVFIEPQFYAHGRVQDVRWDMNVSYSGDFLPRPGLKDVSKFDSKNDIVNGQSIDLRLDQLIQKDGKNIYRCVIVGDRASFFFALPREWRFDNRRYPYLKFKMFIGCDKSLVSNIGGNNHHVFRAPWIRPMNRLWGFSGNSDYGQEVWDPGRHPSMTDEEIQKSWREYTVNMSNNDGGDDSNKRNRVYVFNIGHEDGVTWKYDPNNEIVIYIADVRLCKTPND